LTWQQSGSWVGGLFKEAPIYIEKLNKMDLLDWRLPTLQEAIPLMEPAESKSDGLYIDPLFGETQKRIWTADKQGASSVRVVNFSYGYCYFSHVCQPQRRSSRSLRTIGH